MKVIQNELLHEIPLISQNVDDKSRCAYKLPAPLEAMNSFSYIVGSAGSGKSSLFLAMLCSRPTRKKPNMPRWFYKYYDKIYLISNSLQSLPLNKLGLDESRVHAQYSDEVLQNIIETEHESTDNDNCLLILDDCIADLKKSKATMKLILNRRHVFTNEMGCGAAGCSIWVLSQKFNALPLVMRCNTSAVYLFKTSNRKELDCIKNELMSDLNPEEQEEVLKIAWDEPYSFLLIMTNAPKNRRYFRRFDPIIIDTD